MSKKIIAGVAALALSSAAVMPAWAEAKLDSLTDRMSYIMGYGMVQNMRERGVDIDSELAMAAIEDALAGKPSRLNDEERQQTFKAFQDFQMARAAQVGTENLENGQKFLAENAKKEGVTVTESGLQYKVLTEGSGPKPSATDTVSVHYHGTLIDGTVFDSSVQRNQPAEFPVNRVIQGWTEALQLMPEGSKWVLYIPADLAYGTRGSPPVIGPNSTLVFEVELLSAKAN